MSQLDAPFTCASLTEEHVLGGKSDWLIKVALDSSLNEISITSETIHQYSYQLDVLER